MSSFAPCICCRIICSSILSFSITSLVFIICLTIELVCTCLASSALMCILIMLDDHVDEGDYIDYAYMSATDYDFDYVQNHGRSILT